MNKKIKSILELKKNTQEYLRIKRKYNADYYSEMENGYIHNYSDELVQLLSIEDFAFVETIIFPAKHIKKVKFNKSDKFYNHILKQEKAIKSIKKVSSPNLKNWKQVFKSINSDCIIIETEMSKNRIFHIGGVTEVKSDGIEFLFFNAEGKFEKEPYQIKYDEITKLTLDSHYAKVFSKYVYP